ncbi:MAG: hypothetical protein QOJ63_2206 [Solirubrobacteraceae bacterium]|nr:hypothetical protein [Solirubrobacteraceae bacterium]
MSTDHQATASADGKAGTEPLGARRSTAGEIARAIDLGWRVAALHALSPTTLTAPSPVTDEMLLNRRSMSASDRLELEVRAVAGVAAGAGIPLEDEELTRLLDLAAGASASPAGEQAFRADLAQQHIAFEKRLWAANEPSGKAYELGNFLSDSWNRVLQPRIRSDSYSELCEIFSPVRVARIKLLLDDLQARVDPVAIHAVSNHLDAWRDRIRDAAPGASAAAATQTPAQIEQQLEPVQRQTVIWRQMLTGDKEPEAYIDHAKRAEVRDELTQQLWGRYRSRLRWLLPLLAVLGAALAVLYAHNQDVARGLAGSALALAGTLGITRASMSGALRRGVQSWGDLMWNRALAAVICRETSVLDELYPPAAPHARGARGRTPRG